MKSIKNKIGILVTILILGMAINANAAVSTVISGKDKLTSLKHMESLGVMNKLSNKSEELNKTVKRDEFAKMISIIDGQEDLATSLKGQTIYSDVKTSDSFSSYINAAVNRGLMLGMADRRFHPKDNINLGDLTVGVVKALGYGDSDLPGVSPNNYLAEAKDLSLLDGIYINASGSVPRWAVAVILDRLLETNVKGSDKYFIDAIGEFSDCVILGNSSTMARLDSNQIMTDKGIYYIGSNSSKLQIGNKYRVYIDDNKIEKIYYSFKLIKTYSIKNANSNNISYEDKNSMKTMTLPDKVTYYYNGNKLTYDNLLTTLHTASSIIFANNDNNVGYDYAVIVDPIYSKPVIAKDIKANASSIGSIKLMNNEKILKNGDYIKLTDIQNNDVVYQISDINNANKFIFVIDNKVQGVITGILPNRINPSTIQIDGKSYDISKDMDLLKLTSANSEYKIGDTVQAFSGYDGRIVDISKNAEVGLYSDCMILGNSNTISSLSDNQILTDKGNLYLPNTSLNLQLGAEYRLFISGNKILSAEAPSNKVQNIVVNNINGSQITYSTEGKTSVMTLPDNITYYYQGAKQTYDNLKNIVQGDTTIIFAYDSSKIGYDYAIIADPIYSKPEIAGDEPSNDPKIGSIIIKKGENIVKNGDYIESNNIAKNDVVYQVSDLNNTDQYIYVIDSKTEGVLTGILPNRLYPKTIQIDNKSYDISNDMKLDKIINPNSDYKIGDTVQVFSGYDNKIVDISKDAVVAANNDCIILGNSSTINSLDTNQILTDKGTFYLSDPNMKLQIGSKYRLYIGNNKIISSIGILNTVQNVVVNNLNNSQITYIANGKVKKMTLPDNTVYYYNGTKQTYDNLKNVIQGDSTVIFSYNDEKNGYDYAVIVDPIYSKPVIASNVKVGDTSIGGIDLSDWKSVVRNGDYISPYDITNGEVVYQVSDIGSTNKYLLVLDGIVSGKLTAILPNRISPKIIQIDNKNYDISDQMELSILANKGSLFKIGDTVQITLGYDSKAVALDYPDGQDNSNYAYVENISVGNDNGTPIYYVKLLKSDGTVTQYESTIDTIAMKGELVTFTTSVDGTTAKLTELAAQSYPDLAINKENLSIGNLFLTSNLRIFNVISNYNGSDANVKMLSLSDLYSGVIPAGKITYLNHVGDFGDVNVMVLNDLYNQSETYAIVKTVSTVVTRGVTTNSYSINVNGKDTTWTTTTGYGIKAGDVIGIDDSTGQVLNYYGTITPESHATSVQAISSDRIKLNNMVYSLTDDAKVYYRDANGNITPKAITDVDITKTYENVAIYLDKGLNYNGKVKMVIITGQ